MEKEITLEKIVEKLVLLEVVSKDMGELMLESNSGVWYENILTHENNEPTNFFIGLLELANLDIKYDDEADIYIVTEK